MGSIYQQRIGRRLVVCFLAIAQLFAGAAASDLPPKKRALLGDVCRLQEDCAVKYSVCTPDDGIWQQSSFCVCQTGYLAQSGYCMPTPEHVRTRGSESGRLIQAPKDEVSKITTDIYGNPGGPVFMTLPPPPQFGADPSPYRPEFRPRLEPPPFMPPRPRQPQAFREYEDVTEMPRRQATATLHPLIVEGEPIPEWLVWLHPISSTLEPPTVAPRPAANPAWLPEAGIQAAASLNRLAGPLPPTPFIPSQYRLPPAAGPKGLPFPAYLTGKSPQVPIRSPLATDPPVPSPLDIAEIRKLIYERFETMLNPAMESYFLPPAEITPAPRHLENAHRFPPPPELERYPLIDDIPGAEHLGERVAEGEVPPTKSQTQGNSTIVSLIQALQNLRAQLAVQEQDDQGRRVARKELESGTWNPYIEKHDDSTVSTPDIFEARQPGATLANSLPVLLGQYHHRFQGGPFGTKGPGQYFSSSTSGDQLPLKFSDLRLRPSFSDDLFHIIEGLAEGSLPLVQNLTTTPKTLDAENVAMYIMDRVEVKKENTFRDALSSLLSLLTTAKSLGTTWYSHGDQE